MTPWSSGLETVELEAVLAHEIGHYRRGHIPRMMALSAAVLAAGFWALSVLGHAGRLVCAGLRVFAGAARGPRPYWCSSSAGR